jgi:hypothetical protein
MEIDCVTKNDENKKSLNVCMYVCGCMCERRDYKVEGLCAPTVSRKNWWPFMHRSAAFSG